MLTAVREVGDPLSLSLSHTFTTQHHIKLPGIMLGATKRILVVHDVMMALPGKKSLVSSPTTMLVVGK